MGMGFYRALGYRPVPVLRIRTNVLWRLVCCLIVQNQWYLIDLELELRPRTAPLAAAVPQRDKPGEFAPRTVAVGN